MNGDLSTDAQAALLLTGRLGKHSDALARPLTPTEWERLQVWVHDRGRTLSEAVEQQPQDFFLGWDEEQIPAARLYALLGRGALLGLAAEKWARAGIWVISYRD